MTEKINTLRPQKSLFLTVKLKDAAGAAGEYAGHVSNISVAPTTATASWAGGTPEAQLSATTITGHTLSLNVAQDVENKDSLWTFLRKNAGKLAVFSYGPHKDGTFRTAVEAEIIPPNLGGAVNAYNESPLSMGCSAPVDTFPA